jgi:eukaryotic-like serine/threonine-protein kinase
MNMATPEADLRALDLFERLLAYPGNERFRTRLLKRETPGVLAALARIEAGHAARGAMPTEFPDTVANVAVAPPERIGPFRLTTRIGQGGMGDVWRGERDDGLFDQSVAIKLIHAHLDSRAQEAFEAERRILAKLDHPDIVRLTDGGVTENGLPYLIMDHVEGVAFDEAVATLPLPQRIRLFIQACNVVQFAHSRLVAHADLKPSNIMVDTEGRVRLLDFGIAGLLGGDADARAPSGAMTREYASPERIAGAPPSIADDVYALGRMLALIAGTVPSGIVPIPQGGQSPDDDLNAIAAKASADEEADRYDTVAALIADLNRWQEDKPVAARNGGFTYRARKFVARHRIGVTASALAISALLGTTAYAVVSATRAEHARAEASARYDDAHGIANYLMFDLMARMANQPRSLAMRMDMALKAQHYLDRLARLPGTDTATRLDTAKGFWRLAEFQSKSGHPNLGQADAARANLKTALVLTEGISGLSADALKAHILLDQVSIAANADNDLELADTLLAQAKPLVERAAGNAPSLRHIYQHQLANLRSWQGRYDEEAVAAKAGLALPPLADPLENYAMRDALLDIYGDSLLNTKAREKTLAVYREQVSLGEAAKKRWPDEHMINSRLMYARLNQGVILNALERLPEALAVLEQASREAAAEMAFEPADRWTRAQAQSIDLARGQTLGFMGRLNESMAIYRDWENRTRTAWEASPKEMRLFRPYVQVLALIGEAQGRTKQLADQCRTDARTLTLYDRMRTLGALTKWDEDINLKELKARLKDCR